MEAVMQLVELVFGAVPVGAIALAPGTAVWLVVTGVIVAVRRLGKAIQESVSLADEGLLLSYRD